MEYVEVHVADDVNEHDHDDVNEHDVTRQT